MNIDKILEPLIEELRLAYMNICKEGYDRNTSMELVFEAVVKDLHYNAGVSKGFLNTCIDSKVK